MKSRFSPLAISSMLTVSIVTLVINSSVDSDLVGLTKISHRIGFVVIRALVVMKMKKNKEEEKDNKQI